MKRKSCVPALIAAGLLLVAFAASAEQFLFFERTVVITGNNRLNQDWDFVTGLAPEPGVPKNWVTPVNYSQGTYHLTFEVTEMKPVAKPVDFCIGWQPGGIRYPGIPHNHTLEKYGSFTKPGAYTQDKPLTDMWYGVDNGPERTYRDWSWAMAWHENTLYCYINPYGQDPFPVTVRVLLYIITKDAAFQPARDILAAPSIVPAGGTFNVPPLLEFTGMPGAEVYYTLDNSEPSRVALRYDAGRPITLARGAMVKAKAFKTGCQSSPVTGAKFTITPGKTSLPAIAVIAAGESLAVVQAVRDISLKAEDMRLENYSVDAKMNREGIKIDTPFTAGRAMASFPGPSGRYDVTVAVVPENHGTPKARVFLNSLTVCNLTYPQDSAYSNPARDRFEYHVYGVTVQQNDVVEFSGIRDNGAWARVDRLVFTPADSGALHDTVRTTLSSDRAIDYPNPLDRTMSLMALRIRTSGLQLAVYDSAGVLVRSLDLAKGAQRLAWDGTDAKGRAIKPGLYVCAILSGTDCWREKILVIKKR